MLVAARRVSSMISIRSKRAFRAGFGGRVRFGGGMIENTARQRKTKYLSPL